MAINSPTGFRNTTVTNNSSSAGITPDYQNYTYQTQVPVMPQVPPVNSFSNFEDGSSQDNDNGSAQAARDLGTEVSTAGGGKKLPTDPNQMGWGFMGLATAGLGLGTAGAAGMPAPREGYNGSPGSIGPEGGRYNKEGREIDQITGQAYGYSHPNAFYKGNYMTNVKDNIFGKPKYDSSGDVINNDPFGAIFSDPDNQYKYNPDNKSSQGFQFAEQKSPTLNSGSMIDRNTMALKVGLDSGTPQHSLVGGRMDRGVDQDKDTFTTTNTRGLDKIKGEYTPGFNEGVDYGSSVAHGMDANTGDVQGGVYSTMNSYSQDDGSSTGTKSATATSGRDTATSGPTGTSYAADQQSSGSGSGGGKG